LKKESGKTSSTLLSRIMIEAILLFVISALFPDGIILSIIMALSFVTIVVLSFRCSRSLTIVAWSIVVLLILIAVFVH